MKSLPKKLSLYLIGLLLAAGFFCFSTQAVFAEEVPTSSVEETETSSVDETETSTEEEIVWLTDENGYAYYEEYDAESYRTFRIYSIDGWKLRTMYSYTSSYLYLYKVENDGADSTSYSLPAIFTNASIMPSAFEGSGITELTIPASAFFASDRTGNEVFTGSTINRLNVTGYSKYTYCSAEKLLNEGTYRGLMPTATIYFDTQNGVFCSGGYRFLIRSGYLYLDSQYNPESADGKIAVPSYFEPTVISSLGECAGIKSFKIPKSVTSIWSFKGTSISSITIPDTVTYVSNTAFDNCNDLKTISYKDSSKAHRTVYSWGKCTATITFNKNAQMVYSNGARFYIEKGALKGLCIVEEGLRTLTFPDSVKTIPESFICSEGKDSIKQIIFPAKLKEISGHSFAFMKSLEKVTMPETVTKLGRYIFYGCDNLKTITLPKSAEQYEDSAWIGAFSKVTVIVKSGSISNFYSYEISGKYSVTKSTKVSMNITELTILAGDTEYLWLNNTGGYCKNMKSSKKSVVTIDQDGKLTAKKAGTATISIKYKGKTYKCKVTVLKATLENRAKQMDKQYQMNKRSDYHVARICFLWMRSRCSYDYTYSLYWADGILLKHTGVCNSYMDATRYLLNYFNIPCEQCTSNEMNHTWNWVKIGKRWYHTDATWGNFLLTDKQMQSAESGQGAGCEKPGHYNYTTQHKATSTKIDKEYRSKR